MTRQKKINPTYFAFILTILFLGCSKGDDQNQSQEVNNPPVEPPIMSISEVSLNYGYFEDTHSFFVINEGNITFNWNWSSNSSNSFLSASPSSGTLSAGESVEVTLTPNRSNMLTQIYNFVTNITNDEESISLAIQVKNYTEEKWLIEGNVNDAEYDRVNDVMIVVSEAPNEIRKFDVNNNLVESLALNNIPKCVSISQDGNYAAIGHNGSFSYVNLTSMTFENSYTSTTDVYDIILAPNNWVYVFSNIRYDDIRSFNLVTGIGSVTHYSGSPTSDKAKLHPSGDYFYLADYAVIPTGLEKYDITNGIADHLYESPYHSEYVYQSDLWFSEDGSEIIAKSRNVFNISSIQNSDMTYKGVLESDNNGNNRVIETLDYHTNTGRIYTIFNYDPSIFGTSTQPSNKVRRYHTTNYSFLGDVELPQFIVPYDNNDAVLYDSHGYFGFFNTDGSKFFVLVQIDDKNNNEIEWAIATLDVL